uniref:Peptidase S1 domain-containing protein n=1 Tax=Acrobeloides nanus TaxID=290746 RepID=A0A914EPU2_9BILA
MSGTIHNPTKCGIRPAIDEARMAYRRLGKRIIGGNDTQDNTIFPWFCSIVFVDEKDEYFCGATLISSTELLTAAHCITEPLKWLDPKHTVTKVYCGKPGDLKPSRPASFHIHPNYTEVPVRDDIAIVKLRYEYNLNDDIQPICLPSEDRHLSEFHGWVVGRGLT